MHPPPHVIPGTEVHRLRAAGIDQEYRISVALPRGYAEDGRPYPVLYVLDADIGFGTIVEGYRMLSLERQLRDVLIVGIGYPVDDLTETLITRTRDFTPTVDDGKLRDLREEGLEDPPTELMGGAGRYLEFIRAELMPFIADRYRSDHADAGVAGVSLGGLFATWCLLSQPGTFGRYVAASPSLWWDEGLVFRLESERAHGPRRLSAQVFLSAGGDESPSTVRDVRRLGNSLSRHRYEGLDLTVRVFPGEVHRSAWAPALLGGLRLFYRTA